jgi:hypothetical protein
MSKLTLEQRISDALKTDIAAAEIANLIVEVENALADAEQNAASVRDRSLDPIAFPHAVKAKAAVDTATFIVDRLRAAQSRLTQGRATRKLRPQKLYRAGRLTLRVARSSETLRPPNFRSAAV